MKGFAIPVRNSLLFRTFPELRQHSESGKILRQKVPGTRDLLASIRSSLESGTASLTQLGDGPAAVLDLDEPGGLERYAAVLRPRIQLALKNNRRERTMIIVLLIALFVLAAALTVYDQLYGSKTVTRIAVLPGLGIAAVWPVQSLIALNRQAVALEVFPSMLPLLTRQQAARLAERFLSKGLAWDTASKAARSSR
jgi:hypothetical protein